MERIFKIETKSNRNPNCQYPSERRYSASMVIGLSVVFGQLFIYSVLMGTLIVHKMAAHHHQKETEEEAERLRDKVGRDIAAMGRPQHTFDTPVLVCSGCFLMSLGHLLSCCTGLCAWKRWYVDRNIALLFVASTFSTLTSALGLLLATLAWWVDLGPDPSAMTPSLLANITLLSVGGLVWSCLSTRVAYRGMRRAYPDDMVVGRGGGRVVVSTVMGGDKGGKAFPPDLISHFPAGEKLAKYLPRKEEGGLPKGESVAEYRERVGRFLEGSGGGEVDCAEGR